MQKYFETGCFYCGSPDHPRFKCPKLTAVLTERGLRRVNGQWVATPDGTGTGSAPGSQSGEEWYCSMLDGSDGSELGAVFSPPPVPTGDSRRLGNRAPRQTLLAGSFPPPFPSRSLLLNVRRRCSPASRAWPP